MGRGFVTDGAGICGERHCQLLRRCAVALGVVVFNSQPPSHSPLLSQGAEIFRGDRRHQPGVHAHVVMLSAYSSPGKSLGFPLCTQKQPETNLRCRSQISQNHPGGVRFPFHHGGGCTSYTTFFLCERHPKNNPTNHRHSQSSVYLTRIFPSSSGARLEGRARQSPTHPSLGCLLP